MSHLLFSVDFQANHPSQSGGTYTNTVDIYIGDGLWLCWLIATGYQCMIHRVVEISTRVLELRWSGDATAVVGALFSVIWPCQCCSMSVYCYKRLPRVQYLNELMVRYANFQYMSYLTYAMFCWSVNHSISCTSSYAARISRLVLPKKRFQTQEWRWTATWHYVEILAIHTAQLTTFYMVWLGRWDEFRCCCILMDLEP